MKKFALSTVMLMTSALSSVTLAAPVTIKISSVQQFLEYMDLESIYLGGWESGAPGFFLAVPAVPTMKAGEPAPSPEHIDDVMGYYFKGATGNVATSMYNDNAPSMEGMTGSAYGYPCLDDKNRRKAIMDVAALNVDVMASAKPSTLTPRDLDVLFKGKGPLSDAQKEAMVEKASRAKGKLMALKSGTRIVDLKRDGVFIDCRPADPAQLQKAVDESNTKTDMNQRFDTIREKGGWAPLPKGIVAEAKGYEGRNVQVTATWNSGTKVMGKDKLGNAMETVVDAGGQALKADSINIINFGNFSWMKHKDGKLKNADILIELYRDMGYVY